MIENIDSIITRLIPLGIEKDTCFLYIAMRRKITLIAKETKKKMLSFTSKEPSWIGFLRKLVAIATSKEYSASFIAWIMYLVLL